MNDGSLRRFNLVFRFLLEIVVLVALFLWGTSISDQLIVQVLLGIGAPAVVIAVWAIFVAPKASRRLPDPQRLAVEVVVFGAGVLAFLAAGQLLLAVLLAIASGLNLWLMFDWGQRGR
ncbi:MAG TPA: YrdB family protein [Vicinamibacterales bacterium]